MYIPLPLHYLCNAIINKRPGEEGFESLVNTFFSTNNANIYPTIVPWLVIRNAI